MKKLKLLVSLLFIIFFYHYNYSQNRDVNLPSTQSKEVLQNYVVYSPLVQSKSTNSGVEVTATVLATCYGNQSNSLFISPTYCAWDDGLIGMTFSNGSSLTPGQNSTITFKFKKTVTANQTFEYKFSTNGSCSSPQIKITVNYLFNSTPPPPNCTLGTPMNLTATNIGTTEVTLNWSQVNNNQGYAIYYGYRASYGYEFNITTSINTNTVTLTNLLSGIQYFFGVIALHPTCSTTSNTNGSFTTLCPILAAPTNITATSSGYGYVINCIPPYYYDMEYVDLVTNQFSTCNISTGSTINTGSNFFYYVSPPKSFKFRLKRFNNECTSLFSEWIIVTPSLCNNYPTNLSFNTQSVCGLTPGHICGAGQFSWSPVEGSIEYQVEYQGINLTNTSASPISSSFKTTEINTVWGTGSTNEIGTWILKYRVKSRCSNGTWSDFSPWSSNFAF